MLHFCSFFLSFFNLSDENHWHSHNDHNSMGVYQWAQLWATCMAHNRITNVIKLIPQLESKFMPGRFSAFRWIVAIMILCSCSKYISIPMIVGGRSKAIFGYLVTYFASSSTCLLNLLLLLYLPPWPPSSDYFFSVTLPRKASGAIDSCQLHTLILTAYSQFLDGSNHLYMRVCPSVGLSVGR